MEFLRVMLGRATLLRSAHAFARTHGRTTDDMRARVVDGGVTATGVLSRERGNLITISITLY